MRRRASDASRDTEEKMVGRGASAPIWKQVSFMARNTPKRVAILEGNATIARLMGEVLEETGAFEVEYLRDGPPGAARAHLAIVDVDSGAGAADQWIRHCDGRQLPVIVCGVESSRGRYSNRPWLSRPFSPQQLKSICREVLGESPTDDDEAGEIPPGIDAGAREQPTVEIPDQGAAKEADVGSMTDEQPTARQSTEELLDVLDLDSSGSMIVEIEEISDDKPGGGRLKGGSSRQALGPEELTDENPWADAPDTAVETPEGRRRATPVPTRGDDDRPGTEPSARADVTTVSALGDVPSGDFSGAHQVASLVAEHWDRLGLTARPADRAERLQRVLSAMLRDGMDGVLDELKRIPPVDGFSGRLETMPVVDLLHTIRDRRLRGRLEVGLKGHSFVLYIDRTTLEGIDSLGENTDGMLVDVLYGLNSFDDETRRHYQRLVGKLRGEPLEMKLRRDGVVGEGELLEAKKERAKRLLAKMCRSEEGTFAFIEMPHESGQSWPTQGLNLNVDALVLEMLREEVDEDSPVSSVSRADLVIDAERASRLEAEALTDAEERMLEVFRDGRSVDSAREVLGETDEPVERVVRRLKRLELLRRLGEDGEENSEPSGSTEPTGGEDGGDDPHQGPTAVGSSWNLEILDEVDEAAVEETEEDVGFAAGVPEEFSPEFDTEGSSDDDDR